ncbi:MAG: MFS transporter, partial [Propionibacteriaceae bacterium]
LLLGVGIFIVGSVLAGAATSAALLIGARGIQGVGGAMVLPSTLSTLNATFRGADRATAFGMWGAIMSGTAAIGPLLGAWLTRSFSWRAIFFVNVPLGLAVIVCAVIFVPENHGEHTESGADVVGLALSALGFGALVFALIEGIDQGWWRAKGELSVGTLSLVPLAVIFGAIALVLFVWNEHRRAARGKSVIMRLNLFTIPSFAWGNIAAAMVAAGEFGLVFVLPLYLMTTLQLSIMQAGLVLAAMALGAFASGSMARRASQRLGGAAGVVVLGLVLELLGIAALATLGPLWPRLWLLSLYLVIYGIGLGFAAAQLTSTVLAQVPTQHSGSASATQSTFRQVGSALGSAVVGTVLATSLATTVPRQLANLMLPAGTTETLTDSLTRSAGGALIRLRRDGNQGPYGDQTPAVVDALTRAFADSCVGAMWAAFGFVVLGLIGAVVVWRKRPR